MAGRVRFTSAARVLEDDCSGKHRREGNRAMRDISSRGRVGWIRPGVSTGLPRHRRRFRLRCWCLSCWLPVRHPPARFTRPAGRRRLAPGLARSPESPHGAQVRQRATESRVPTVLRFFCHGIQRNFIGSYVLIRFPSKNFSAFVELRRTRIPGEGSCGPSRIRPR